MHDIQGKIQCILGAYFHARWRLFCLYYYYLLVHNSIFILFAVFFKALSDYTGIKKPIPLL